MIHVGRGGWNHRIILHDDDPDPTQHWLGLHEVYYDEDERITGWVAEPSTFITSVELGRDDLLGELELVVKTLHKPKWMSVLSLRELRTKSLRCIDETC